MANKNIGTATLVASVLDSDSIFVEVGGSLRRLKMKDFRSSINMNDEQVLY